MKVERQERQTLIGKPDKVRELCQQGDLTFCAVAESRPRR